MIKIVSGLGINPNKAKISKFCNTLVLIENIGLFKERQYDLTNNIINLSEIKSNVKNDGADKTTFSILSDKIFNTVDTVVGFVLNGNHKKHTLVMKLRDSREIVLTCNLDEFLLLQNIYFNTEKPKEKNKNNLTIQDLKQMKEDGIISEEEYKEKAREMMGL